MVLVPNRPKYRKQMKGSAKGLTKGGSYVVFGQYGMKALSRGRISSQQIEACRIAINRHFSRKGKVWIRVFPDKPVTKKPAETRMGKGKGGVDHWEAVVRPGLILFEVANVTEADAKVALCKGAAKLPVCTKFVGRVEEV